MGSQVMNGPRAKVITYDPNTGASKVIGIFSAVSYGLHFQHQSAAILGRYTVAAIDYTGVDEVGITASGYRVIDHGAHVDAACPTISDLLNQPYISLDIVDRQLEAQGRDARIAKFVGVRPVGYDSSITARNLTDLTVNFVGISVSDESVTNVELPTSVDLPS